MKKVLFILLFICFIPFVNAKSYYTLVGSVDLGEGVDMPVAYHLNDGNFLLAATNNGVPFIRVIDPNGETVKNINIPSVRVISFYNIFKTNGIYYVYGGYFSSTQPNVHIIYYLIDSEFNFVEKRELNFTDTRPASSFVGYEENADYFYDYGSSVKINKNNGEMDYIKEDEYPSFVLNPDEVIKREVNDTAHVALIYKYMDGFAVVYRADNGTINQQNLGFVKDNDLKWSVEADSVDYFNLHVFSDYIVTNSPDINYENTALKLYDAEGNLVSGEIFNNYTQGTIDGSYVRGGIDYFNVVVELYDISSGNYYYKMFFFRNSEHEYYIYLKDTENGTITVSKQRAKENETVGFNTISDDGYVLGEVKIVGNDGKEIDIANNSFVMPNSNVVISGRFVTGSNGGSSNAVVDNGQDNPKTSSQTMYILLTGSLLILAGIIYYNYYRIKAHK